MTSNETYRIATFNNDDGGIAQPQIVEVLAASEYEAAKLARAQTGRKFAVIVASTRDGQSEERDFTVQLEGNRWAEGPTYRATSGEQALELARAEHGERVKWIGPSVRVTFAQRVAEARQQAGDGSVDAIANSLGYRYQRQMAATVTEVSDDELATSVSVEMPAHYVFADRSVINAADGLDHYSTDDLRSWIREEAELVDRPVLSTDVAPAAVAPTSTPDLGR